MTGHAAEPTGDSQTAQILETIEQTRNQRTVADRQAAFRLNAQGDRAYRKRDYSAAFTAYANSYPNYPTAHAYILASDMHWRNVVTTHGGKAGVASSAASGGTAACGMDNSHFGQDVTSDVSQHYEVGLALAEREHDQHFMHSTIYRRAQSAAVCLRALGRSYATQPKETCIDISKIGDCLGAPLLK